MTVPLSSCLPALTCLDLPVTPGVSRCQLSLTDERVLRLLCMLLNIVYSIIVLWIVFAQVHNSAFATIETNTPVNGPGVMSIDCLKSPEELLNPL